MQSSTQKRDGCARHTALVSFSITRPGLQSNACSCLVVTVFVIAIVHFNCKRIETMQMLVGGLLKTHHSAAAVVD